jgi:hypothetical protein
MLMLSLDWDSDILLKSLLPYSFKNLNEEMYLLYTGYE